MSGSTRRSQRSQGPVFKKVKLIERDRKRVNGVSAAQGPGSVQQDEVQDGSCCGAGLGVQQHRHG